MNRLQWVVDVIPCRRPHADGLETCFGFQVSSFFVHAPRGSQPETSNSKRILEDQKQQRLKVMTLKTTAF